MSKVYDLVGQRFGRLVVIEKETKDIPKTSKPRVWWKCKCDCGNTVIVTTTRLVTGVTKSCGCYRADVSAERMTTHGCSHEDRLYNAWVNMRSRCFCKGNSSYKNYGARGISVCDEWKDYYEPFKEWAMSHGYDPAAKRGDCTLDRIDPNGDYCPENCRWVDMLVQGNNKRNNVHITMNGKIMTLSEASKEYGISDSTIRERLCRGWSVESALTTPARVMHYTGKYVGVNKKHKKEKFYNE